MADTIKLLAQSVLPTSTGVIYTVPALTMTTIRSMLFCNTSAAAVTINMFVNGTAAGNQILKSFALNIGDTYIMDSILTLDAAKTLQGNCSAGTSVTITVSGVESA